MDPAQTPPVPQTFGQKNDRKKLIVGLFVFVLVVLGILFMSIFLSHSTSTVSQNSSQISPTSGLSRGNPYPTSAYGDNNPLISKNEQQRESDAYNNLYKNGNVPTPAPVQEHHLKFILPAKYLDNTSSFLSIPKAYASSTSVDCSGKLSGTVQVYVLKNNLTKDLATIYATAFGLSTIAASVPMGDGSSFYYQYTNNYTSFLNVAQPSAELHYHVAMATTPTPGGSSLSQPSATTKAKTYLSNLLDTNAVYDNGTTISSGNEFITTFTKSYALSSSNPEFVPMVNNDTIVAQATTDVCQMSQASDTNTVEIHQAQTDGTLTKIDDTTRKIDTISSATGISVDESVDKEYGVDKPSLEPIVIPLTAKTADLDTVSVSSVALVWFDYPDTYNQVAYVPMYLLAGTLKDGTKAYGLFPAISKTDFAKLPGGVGASTSNTHLQLQPYYPPLPKPAGPVGGCFGSQVDYTVTCRQNTGSGAGVTICYHYFEGYVGSKNTSGYNNDPLNICKTGNQRLTDPSFSAPAGSDVCKAFVSKQGIDTSGNQPGAYPGFPYGGGAYSPQNGSSGYDGSPVVCTLSGNPC